MHYCSLCGMAHGPMCKIIAHVPITKIGEWWRWRWWRRDSYVSPVNEDVAVSLVSSLSEFIHG